MNDMELICLWITELAPLAATLFSLIYGLKHFFKKGKRFCRVFKNFFILLFYFVAIARLAAGHKSAIRAFFTFVLRQELPFFDPERGQHLQTFRKQVRLLGLWHFFPRVKCLRRFSLFFC